MPIIINLTVVYADWKEVWCNAEKRNWTITYTDTVSVLVQYQNRYWTQTATLSAFTILSPNYPLD